MRKNYPFSYAKRFYATLDLFHQTDNYYNADRLLLKQEPQVKVQPTFGSRFYNGALDISLVTAWSKSAQTLQISQVRPYLDLKVYPLLKPWIEMMVYAQVYLPHKDSHIPAYAQGSVVDTGSHMKVSYDFKPYNTLASLTAGTDIWTRFYSRRPRLEPQHADATTLELLSSRNNDERSHPALFNQSILEVSLAEGVRKRYLGQFALIYDRHHKPFYQLKATSQNKDYRYKVDHSSRLRLRLQWSASRDVYVRNDFERHFSALVQEAASEAQVYSRNIFALGYKF